MDNKTSRDNLITYWEETKKVLTEYDFKYIGNKLDKSGKMIGYFTSSYRKREKLIKNSFITTGYTFKMWQNDNMRTKGIYSTWVLFSPSKELVFNLSFFENVMSKINELKGKENKTIREKRFLNLFLNNISDCQYIEINKFIQGLKFPVYLSTCYLLENTCFGRELGLNLIIFNKKISKEILYLPDEYYPDSFTETLKHARTKRNS